MWLRTPVDTADEAVELREARQGITGLKLRLGRDRISEDTGTGEKVHCKPLAEDTQLTVDFIQGLDSNAQTMER